MLYTETEARRVILDSCHRLLASGLVARTWGNISARISSDKFIITPSGRDYESLTEDDLVVVNVSDASYEGDIKPSSEKGVHAAAYSVCDDISFIIHTHQYYASAVAAECMDVSFAPCAAYGLPGTSKLKRNVEKCIKDNIGCREFLMARHGTLILGSDSEEAFERASELEEKCRALVDSRIPSCDVMYQSDFNKDAIVIKALPFITVISDKYIMECCRSGMTVQPYIDDFAQIVGPDMQICDNDAWAIQRKLLGYSSGKVSKQINGRMPMTGALDRMGGQQAALNSLIGRNAVLVRGVGAVCAGKTEGDAHAIASIVSKNCAAACYVRRAKPLDPLDARLQRYTYLTKYSKRINE